ncbi:MAG: UDP-2,3-diacylglucosamine diphosphatase [Campylobacterota bacterium]|nr:UDP-2,3-diacylglucosamine diphosphatase [Campylobacterota bacterium]
MSELKKFRSIFISDVHLGTKYSKAEELLEFIRDYESENLYLVGDIIDGWAIKRKFVWKQSHSDVIQKILRKARKSTNVYFIAGNHDEFLRPFIPILLGDRLRIESELEYIDLHNRRFLVTHGDFFDSITMTKKWLAVLGDYGYDLLLSLNGFVNLTRRIFGRKRYWSLSKYAKDSIKSSVSFISDYESILALHAKRNDYDGVICGHIHKAEIRDIEGIQYLNCGDWVENCTAVVETMDGEWKIINFLER